MSYDILLYPRRPDQTWDEVVAADEDEVDDVSLGDETALAAGTATFRRIEDRLREVLPGELETWVAEETGGDVYGELSDPATGLQVELYARSAAVSFPYWEHEDLEAFHEQVRRTVEVVSEETGYEAYDPQTGAGFDGDLDDARGREAVRQLAAEERSPAPPDERDPEAEAGASPARAAVPAGRSADPRQDPAFLRRRGILYLVLGALLTLFGFWRLNAVGSGWLTVLVLAIGVLDLLGGVFMLSLSRRAAEARAGRAD